MGIYSLAVEYVSSSKAPTIFGAMEFNDVTEANPAHPENAPSPFFVIP